MDMELRKLKATRLRIAREKAGYPTAEAAAERFNWGASGYRHHENETRSFGGDAAKKYGKAFKVRAAWLMGMDDDPGDPATNESAAQLLVNGGVAAGIWRESERWNDDRTFTINLACPVPGAKRFGMVVEGNSMNEVYEPDTVLDCISIFEGGVQPSTGDHVIVERIRPDGLREMTVKEYREEDGRYLLVPRSRDPKHKPLGYPGPDVEQEGGETIQVIGFVVADYPPRTLALFQRMGLIERGADTKS